MQTNCNCSQGKLEWGAVHKLQHFIWLCTMLYNAVKSLGLPGILHEVQNSQ